MKLFTNEVHDKKNTFDTKNSLSFPYEIQTLASFFIAVQTYKLPIDLKRPFDNVCVFNPFRWHFELWCLKILYDRSTIVFAKVKNCYHVTNCYLLDTFYSDMDRCSFEACLELGAAKLVTDSVLTQNAYQIEFISRQERQDSNKKVIITFLFVLFNILYLHIHIFMDTIKSN